MFKNRDKSITVVFLIWNERSKRIAKNFNLLQILKGLQEWDWFYNLKYP